MCNAISLDPKLTLAYRNLGNAFEKTGRPDEARAAFRQALELDPGQPEIHNNLGNVLKSGGLLDEALVCYRRALEIQPDFQMAHSNLLLGPRCSTARDARGIFEAHRRWHRNHAACFSQGVAPHTHDRDSDRRLRVGCLSPDFRDHPVSWFMLPLLGNHDHARFETVTYSQGRGSDEWTSRVRCLAGPTRDITSLPDDQVAGLVREDRIDILVDLALHSAGNRLLVFARKPAPVQVTWLAYAGTCGLDAMDYRISDPWIDPPGSDDSVYSETTVRLPASHWCYQPELAPPVGPSPALVAGHVTFGSLNNFCKVNDRVLALWTRLLEMAPASRLHLHAAEGDHRARLLKSVESRGVDPVRVIFSPGLPKEGYLELYDRIDIALDPFPYGGGTTTCDARWMGVPVITLKGETAVGRGGASILSNIGLPELVARTETEHLAIASGLATNPGRLAGLRDETLRDRMLRSPLMDAPAFARGMESAFRQMWRDWCGK